MKFAHTPRRQTIRGFTLIELMIVVGIVGILAAIAYPSYQESILKGRRAEARTAILDLMQQQERYMTQNGTYRDFTNVAGTVTPAVPFKTYSGESPATPLYFLSAETCPPILIPATPAPPITTCVQISATPRIAASDAKAGVLRANSTGTKSCTGTDPGVCWK